MPYYRVTHPNGLTEIMGEPTPREEIEFLPRWNPSDSRLCLVGWVAAENREV